MRITLITGKPHEKLDREANKYIRDRCKIYMYPEVVFDPSKELFYTMLHESECRDKVDSIINEAVVDDLGEIVIVTQFHSIFDALRLLKVKGEIAELNVVFIYPDTQTQTLTFNDRAESNDWPNNMFNQQVRDFVDIIKIRRENEQRRNQENSNSTST